MSTQLPPAPPRASQPYRWSSSPCQQALRVPNPNLGIGGRGSWPHFGVQPKINRGFWKGKAPARNSIEMYWIVITGRRPEKMPFFLDRLKCSPDNIFANHQICPKLVQKIQRNLTKFGKGKLWSVQLFPEDGRITRPMHTHGTNQFFSTCTAPETCPEGQPLGSTPARIFSVFRCFLDVFSNKSRYVSV